MNKPVAKPKNNITNKKNNSYNKPKLRDRISILNWIVDPARIEKDLKGQ